MLRLLAPALLISALIPFEQPTAFATARDWIAVPDTHELWCVDRNSIRRDGSWAFWDDQMCGIEAFPISPMKADCSQDLSAGGSYYSQRKGEWLLRHIDAQSGAAFEVSFVCSKAGVGA